MSMRSDRIPRVPQRLFRVDTPLDLVLSQAVACREPGLNDTLLATTANLGNKASADEAVSFRETMSWLSRGHRWARLEWLPVDFLDASSVGRLRRIVRIGSAVRYARSLVPRGAGGPLSVSVTHTGHPNHTVFWYAFPHTRRLLAPHTSWNFTPWETGYNRARLPLPPFFGLRALAPFARLAGILGAPLDIHVAYGCRTPLPLARENVLLSETHAAQFWSAIASLMPPELRDRLSPLRDGALLLPSSHAPDSGAKMDEVIGVTVASCQAAAIRSSVRHFWLKAHPAGPEEWPIRLLAEVGRACPDLRFHRLEWAKFVPSEVAAAAALPRAAIIWDSSSVSVLSQTLGVPCYGAPQTLWRHMTTTDGRAIADDFFETHGAHFISVD